MHKTKLFAIAVAGMLAAVSAHADPGNNGGGNGGCGIGQQTNGCGTPGPVGPQGPQGEKGDKGDTGATGAAGKDGVNGINGKDGVNGSNGKDGAQGATGAKGDTGAQGVQGAQGVAGLDGKDAVLPTNLATKQDVQNVQNAVNGLRRDSYAGTASAMAVGALPQPTEAGKSLIAIGSATYRGQQGYALGVSHVTGNNRYVVKGAVTGDSRGGFGAAVGAGYQF